MAVENVGAEEPARDAERRAGEDGEADVVVGIIDAGFAVEALAVEERRAIDQVDGKLLRRPGRWQCRTIGAAEVDGQVVVDAAAVLRSIEP